MWNKIDRKTIIYFLVIGILVIITFYLFVITVPYYSGFFTFVGKLLIPFIIAMLITYLLHPVIEKLHQLHIHRGVAILLIYLIFFCGVGLSIYLGYPVIVQQITEISKNIPEFFSLYEQLILRVYEYTSFLPEGVHDRMDDMIASIESRIDQLLSNLVGGFDGLMDKVIIITVIPVLVFYFLKDFKQILSFFGKFIPSRYRDDAKVLMKELDKGLGGYIRGQLIVSLFVGFASFLLFMLMKIPYALLLAIILAIVNIIPYFGPIIGAIPVITIAYTAGDSGKVLLVILAIFILQIIESNLLSPYIMGKTIRIHPVAIIFALLFGSQLGGILGMILAVPILMIAKVIVQQFIEFRRT